MAKQITTVLPKSAWGKILIKENENPLVRLRNTPTIILATGIKHYQPSFHVRQVVAKKLQRVSKKLPPQFKLVIIEGFRDLQSQQQEWDRVWHEIKNGDTSLSDEAVEQRVKMLVARPHPLANHHCGGAVDVTLAYQDGTLVDMGTPYISQIINLKDKEKIPMLSNKISVEQKINRSILRLAMEKEGFVWYPGEWWHYCFGDRMWAVYSGRDVALYGSVDLFLL